MLNTTYNEENILNLTYLGIDNWDRPTYKDDKLVIWKDVSLCAHEETKIDKSCLCTSTGNSMDGEPNEHMSSIEKYKNTKINLVFDKIPKPVSEAQRFRYMMLGRMQSDCEAHIGNSPYYDSKVKDIDKHINSMLKLYEELIDKPEWISIEDILELKRLMNGGAIKQEEKPKPNLKENDRRSFLVQGKVTITRRDVIKWMRSMSEEVDDDYAPSEKEYKRCAEETTINRATYWNRCKLIPEEEKINE